MYEDNETRVVRKTRFTDPNTKEGVEVSTVFLCHDHNFTNKGPPIVFETLVFGGRLDDSMNRYATWDEAERGHEEMNERVIKSFEGVRPDVREGNPLIRCTWHEKVLEPRY
jgi:hypothetical protein